MRVRPLGRSGVTVSEIGFGCWGIGGATPGATSYGKTNDQVSLRALREALARGITFFDTSSVYGYGHSEELLGEAFRSCRADVVIATKAGLSRYGELVDFSAAHIRRSLEDSLRRLGTDHVDLLQLHNPPVERLQASEDLRALAVALKNEGLIRAFGVSVREPADGLVALEKLLPDAIQVNLNLLDQRALDCGLLEAVSAAGSAVVARTPLCFGFLADGINEDAEFDADDHRSRWPREQIAWWARGARAMRDLARPGENASLLALRYCLSFPSVASVIPGMLTPQEVVENAAASASGPLDAQTLTALRRIYEGLGQPVGRPVDPGKIDRRPASAPA